MQLSRPRFCCVLLCFFVLASQSCLATGELFVDESECRELLGPGDMKVYFGWRFKLGCLHFGHRRNDTVLSEVRQRPTNDTFECTIWDDVKQELKWNLTTIQNARYIVSLGKNWFVADEVGQDSPASYRIRLRSPILCVFLVIHLNKVDEGNRKCRDFPKRDLNYQQRLGNEGPFFLDCEIPGEPDVNLPNVTIQEYKWQHNCQRLSPSENLSIDKATGQLELKTLDSFDAAGEYTCSAIYKNRTRFVVRHNVCLEYDTTAGSECILKCPSEVRATIGEDAKIECTADYGLGRPKEKYVKAKWYSTKFGENKGLGICVNDVGQGSEMITMNQEKQKSTLKGHCEANGRLFCRTEVVDEYCYMEKPKCPEPIGYKVIATLVISAITEDALGNYSLSMTFYRKVKATATFAIVLNEEILEKSNSHHAAIAVTVAAVAAVALLAGYWLRHDLLWIKKKYFGSYDIDNYTYMAHLAYFYDTEKMSEASKNLTKKLVESLHDFMRKFGGSTFDSQKDVSPEQYDANTIRSVQSACHRIIIVLTREYITDQWSLHTTYEALAAVINNGKKVIFIVAPGALTALDELQDETKLTLRNSIKRNVTIQWDGRSPFRGKFVRRLEYALPKLPEQRLAWSTTSATHVHQPQQNIAKNGEGNGRLHTQEENQPSPPV